ncbi:hypothetical protein RN001_010563 [Aquatica leii]|uniref:sn-1-specific diacylglycerol lipase ABHD11 n=1 Tax=Aquatica leii TaxID=1421715 RepID=A0AAN7SEI4_9COLE|nr:hypothetical protein RN001_010563 [Aquatica leii]
MLKTLSVIARKNSDVPLVNGLKPVLLASETYTNETPDGSSAPPVLVIHGLFGTKTNWTYIGRKLANKTKPQRSIIVTDARNHGSSPHSDEHSYAHMCADWNYLMNLNNIEKVAVMGHSMGGRCAMYFSLTQPERVDKVIILDVSPANHSKKSEFSQIKFLLEKMNEVKMPKNVSKSEAREDIDRQLAVDVPQQKLRQFLLTNLDDRDDGSYSWRVNLPVLIKNFYHNIRTFPNVQGKLFDGPVLFLLGAKSDFVRPKDHTLINKLFPKVQIITVEKSGHWLHAEKPNKVIKHCVDFLNG